LISCIAIISKRFPETKNQKSILTTLDGYYRSLCDVEQQDRGGDLIEVGGGAHD